MHIGWNGTMTKVVLSAHYPNPLMMPLRPPIPRIQLFSVGGSVLFGSIALSAPRLIPVKCVSLRCSRCFKAKGHKSYAGHTHAHAVAISPSFKYQPITVEAGPMDLRSASRI